jgi:zinc transporter, ZIP family
MIAFFTDLEPIFQALVATAFTWFLTALGASSVFLTKNINQKVLNGMLGFAEGGMISQKIVQIFRTYMKPFFFLV